MPTRVAFQLARAIYWLLDDDGPVEVSLGFAPEWSLVTPFGFLKRDCEFESCVETNGRRLVSTSHLVLTFQGTKPEMGPVFRHANSVGATIAARLRYLSRQFEISTNFSSISQTKDKVEAVGRPMPPPHGGTHTMIRNYVVPTAVTMEHVALAAAADSTFDIPVHADVMLDALLAHTDQDFRKSILYAAIAIESRATAFVDTEYESLLAASATTPSTRHRVLRVRVNADTEAVKDPVYESLSSGTRFSPLLHERPLYLVGRSLLVDEPDLYRNAVELHGTRNKISHVGTSNAADGFENNIKGSLAALRVATRVLRWFGDTGPYHPWEGFVWAHDGKMAHRVAG